MRALSLSSMFLVACAPDLTVHASRVVAPRVVAVRGDPAEARPGATVTLTATVVQPAGTPVTPTVRWRACLAARSPSESGSIASACLGDDDAGALAPLGGATTATQVTVTIPADACARIGPQTPAANNGEARTRAPDPDVTGGWQLPVRLDLAAGNATETMFARYRVRCLPPDVPGATAAAWATRYVNDANPALTGVFAVVDGAPRGLPRDATTPVDLGALRDVPVLALWDAASAERYVRVDPATRALVERTEALELTWYTDGGSFARDRTVPDASGTASANVLHLDAGVTSARVWVVLRDERGGVDVVATAVRSAG